ncbi:MAG: type IV pilus modification PilV family protein [Vulcanimicrobiaceae bacterium]
MKGRAGERGFSTIEVLVALAIATLVGFAVLGFARVLGATMQRAYTSDAGANALDQLATSLRDQSATSFAVFVPIYDVMGGQDAPDGGVGHEVDLYSQGPHGQQYETAYYDDPKARTVQRWDYDASGARGVRDPSSGVIDPQATYPPIRNVASFTAQRFYPDQLASASVDAGVLPSITGTASPQELPLGFGGAQGFRPDLYGGNAVVEVTLATATAVRTVHLAAGAMASGFTYLAAPRWHAILYRIDQTHRSFGGIVQKSHVFIKGRIDVAYADDDKGSPEWIPWCTDIGIYGNPGGLDPNDPHANYVPSDPAEQANFILGICIHGNADPNNYYASHPTPPPPSAYSPPPGASTQDASQDSVLQDVAPAAAPHAVPTP